MADNDIPLGNEQLGELPPKKGKNPNGHDLCIPDPNGYSICLRMETWEKHIIVGHPELRDKIDLVTKALASPQIVIEQQQGSTSVWFYYRLIERNFYRHKGIYVSVVVEVDEESKTGLVKTAHLVKDIRKGRLIWMRRD